MVFSLTEMVFQVECDLNSIYRIHECAQAPKILWWTIRKDGHSCCTVGVTDQTHSMDYLGSRSYIKFLNKAFVSFYLQPVGQNLTCESRFAFLTCWLCHYPLNGDMIQKSCSVYLVKNIKLLLTWWPTGKQMWWQITCWVDYFKDLLMILLKQPND